MLQSQNEFTRNCHERAARARADADAATDPKKKTEYLAAEARWLSLAQSGSLVERLNHFVASRQTAAHYPSVGRIGRFWPVQFDRGQVVIGHGRKVPTVYFITDAVISLVVPTGLEIAMLGADAGIGMSSALCSTDFPYEAIVRVSGSGLACDAASFNHAVQASPVVLQNVLIAEQKITGLAVEAAIFATSHHLIERLARWFANLHELSGRFELDATQEELSFILGVTRPSVATAQDQLRSEGLLEYHRGKVLIVDPERLRLRARIV